MHLETKTTVLDMIKLNKSNLDELKFLRIEYLDSLPVFQDVFLEFIIKESDCYKLLSDNQPIGYVLVSSDNILLEYFIQSKYSTRSIDIFNLIVNDLSIRSVYCKSFDFQLLDCCLTNSLSYSLNGCLYRDFIDSGIQRNPDLSFRYANSADLPFLYQQDDEVFEPKELLDTYIRNKGIIILQLSDSILGCGFLTQVHPKYKYFDIGVWVNPENRMKGYATQIMLYLKDLCLNNDLVPICGCDIQNIASQKMLGGLGFISKHKLIEFEVIKKNAS